MFALFVEAGGVTCYEEYVLDGQGLFKLKKQAIVVFHHYRGDLLTIKGKEHRCNRY